jgi:hypothetical protein
MKGCVYQDLCLIFGFLIQDHGLDLWFYFGLGLVLPLFFLRVSCNGDIFPSDTRRFYGQGKQTNDSRGVVCLLFLCVAYPIALFGLFVRQLGFGFSVALFCDVFLVSTFAEISWLLFCYMFGVDMLDEDSCIGHLSGWLAMQVEYLATTDGKRIESCKDV